MKIKQEFIRVIIAGGRDFTNESLMIKKLNKFLGEYEEENIIIVSGRAKGADTLGFDLAIKYNLNLHSYPALWDKYGKSAGYRRNSLMADNADMLIAFWDGKSKGTKHMIDIANKKGLKIHIVDY